MTREGSIRIALRHPTVDDQPRLVGLVDEWFGGRRVRHLVGRAWFRHFASTSWVAEDPDADPGGQPLGFLVGYRSPDHPAEGVAVLVSVDPNRRRRGVGRALIDAFAAHMESAGVATLTAAAWPGEPIAIAFFRGVGFEPEEGPQHRNLFGTMAVPDYDGPGEDRIVFVRRVSIG